MSDTVTVVEQPDLLTVVDGDGSTETVVVSDESVTVITAAEQGPEGARVQ